MNRITAAELERAVISLFRAEGLSDAHAQRMATILVGASLDGIDTHGVRLLDTYCKELRGGRAKAQPQLKLASAFPAIGSLDAGHALGVVAGYEAMQIAVERAKVCGIAAISVRNSNHFGAAGQYAKLAAQEGLIGLVFSNSNALVAPFGGTVAMNGTNPLALVAPGLGEEIFYCDMATSQVAYSRVVHFLDQGLELGSGWAQDELGQDSSASRRVSCLQPLGGYKGQGLAMMVQVLTSVLAAMPFDAQMPHVYGEDKSEPGGVSHFFIALQIEGFCPLALFRQRLSELLESFRQTPAKGPEAVIVPGDKEKRTRLERQLLGIPLSEKERTLLKDHL